MHWDGFAGPVHLDADSVRPCLRAGGLTVIIYDISLQHWLSVVSVGRTVQL